MERAEALALLNGLEIEEMTADREGTYSCIIKDTPENEAVLVKLGASEQDLANMRQGFTESVLDIMEIVYQYADYYEGGYFVFKGIKEFDEWVDGAERRMFETERFEKLGKGSDYRFQSLYFLSKASQQLSLATTVLKQEDRVPEESKAKLKQLQHLLHRYTDELRAIGLEPVGSNAGNKGGDQ